MKLAFKVAQMETEHAARGEVIKALRQEREDHLASSLRIRTRLAPLLGCDVNNEPADEMVGRLAALYEARDERVAESRGHDKALLGAATLAGDFDPFSAEWTDEQRIAGERALELFAERLRDEATRSGVLARAPQAISPIEADRSLVERAAAAGARAASSRCIRDDGVELRQTATGFVDNVPHASEEWTPCPTCRMPIRRSVKPGPNLILDASGPHSCALDAIRQTLWERASPPPATETTSWGVSESRPVFAPNEWTLIEMVSFVLHRPGSMRVTAAALVSGGQVGIASDAEEPGFVANMGQLGLYTAETTVTLSKGYHYFALLGRRGATVTERKLSAALLPMVEEGE